MSHVQTRQCQKCGKKLRSNEEQWASALDRLNAFRYCRCPRTETATGTAAQRGDARKTAAQRKELQAERNKTRRLTAQSTIIKGGIVAGNYRIIEKIGTGGMGIVLKVTHVNIGTEYALKLLTPEHINESSWLRFQSEAKLMASLNHPTFVRVYDLGLHNSQLPFYAMDLLSGITLEEAIIQRGCLTLRETLSIFIKVLDGLAYAHKNGIIHRDLKPSNIYLSKRDQNYDDLFDADVKILDFGIAKVGSREGMTVQSLTSTGEIFGSPAYMSPEQCLSAIVDARSDIYSVGCSMFEAMTGFIPFDADSATEMTIMQQSVPAPFLQEVAPTKRFNRAIESVIHKCLEKDPEARYQSARELAVDLAKIRDGKDIEYYKLPLLKGKPRQSYKDNQEKMSLTGALLAMLAIGAMAGMATMAILFFNANKTSQTAIKADKNRNGPVLIDPANEFNIKESCYHMEIEPQAKDYGVFRFPAETTLGSVYSLYPFETFELSGQIEAPIKRVLTYRPSQVVLDHPELLMALRPLNIGSLIMNRQTSVAAANPEECSAQQKKMASFFKAASASFAVTELSIDDISADYYGTLKNLPQLQSLYLRLGSLTNLSEADDIDFLRSHLRSLSIRNCSSVLTFLEEMASGNLTDLSVEARTLADRTISIMSYFPKVERVKLSLDQVSDDQLTDLLHMKALKELDISYKADQMDIIHDILSKECHLKRLVLRGITQVPIQLKPLTARQPTLKIEPLPVMLYKGMSNGALNFTDSLSDYKRSKD